MRFYESFINYIVIRKCCLLFNNTHFTHCTPLFNLQLHKYEVQINFKEFTKDIQCKNLDIFCAIFISGYKAINKS